VPDSNETNSSGFQVGRGVPEQYEAYVAPLMRPFVEVLVSSTVRPGDAVLDVACGTGFATRVAAHATGPLGSVAAIDINPGMLEEARRHLVEHHVDWRQASALELPFDDASFDAVICQQGLQFFPDPVVGLNEMHRVLRPGGRIGATVWAPVNRSPYLAAQRRVLQTTTGLDASVFDQACPTGGEAALLDWAARAGLANFDVQPIEHVIHLPSFASFIPGHLRALPWSAPFFALDPSVQAAAIGSMLDELAIYIDAKGAAHIPTTALLLTTSSESGVE
jgi:SAM-dependent methyltransferase